MTIHLKKRLPNSLLMITMGLFAVGCMSGSKGIDPPKRALIYPVAMGVVDGGDHLLVVNSNFDLQYNAGTLVALKTDGLLDDGTTVQYDQARGVVSLIGTTLDAFCTGGVAAGVCNLDESKLVENDETISLGAYASDLNLTPNGDQALIPVRGEQAIMVVDIQPEKGRLIDCGEGSDGRCDDAHIITGGDGGSLPIEPYRIRIMDYEHDENGKQVVETIGFVTHRAGGEVSVISVSRRDEDGQVTSDPRLIKVLDGVVEGAAGLAVNPRTRDVFVSGQRDPAPHVAVLQLLTDSQKGGSLLVDPWFSQVATVSIEEALYGGTDARAIAVSPDGHVGFVSTQNPPALLKLDLDTYQVTDMVTVCTEVSDVETFVDEGDPATEADDRLLAFVLCFLTGQVYVVDAASMNKVIRRTGEGPQDIVFDKDRGIAYVANFSDSTITMMQTHAPYARVTVADPDDSTEQLVLRIGDGQLPEGE